VDEVRFRRPSSLKVAIDIAPLVDVVFLLVIFFAVSTTFLESSGLKLDLPTSSATVDRVAQELTVSLDADGRLEFDGELVERGALADLLRDALAERADKVVVLRADSTVDHGDVVALMDVIRGAGAEALTVATRSSSE
jgi:biopolymer transport protein ExbD